MLSEVDNIENKIDLIINFYDYLKNVVEEERG